MAQPPDVDEPTDQASRSRSNTSNSLRRDVRPKSRGSTTSIQSVGIGSSFQPTAPVHPIHGDHQQPIYPAPGPNDNPTIFRQNSQDMMVQFPHHQPQFIDHGPGMPQHDMRPMSAHGFQDAQGFAVQYQNGIAPYPAHHAHMHQHMRQRSEQWEGSPAPEDSNNESGRRKKGTASTLANDQELRRLLNQHQGKTLQDVAQEVQKNEGSGGKSEKAKQVFAMLWLRESCVRSSNSVRRDRVFARYTERCANERVPTLNPASFGKLVRIIFPNVQTRRLGVRGESKYHYVDLSLIPEDEERVHPSTYQRPSTAGGMKQDGPGSSVNANNSFQMSFSTHADRAPSRMTVESADFPAPNTSFLAGQEARPATGHRPPQPTRLDCQYKNTATIRIPTTGLTQNFVNALPSLRSDLPASMATYLAMPTVGSLQQPAPSPQDNPVELPDIFPYLAGQNYDPSIARSLFHLYRSYCIDVIDAFRKCKEKPFKNHHSAFNGKMTVPVSKLFNLECLAPWIQECDMRMYKQIVRFIAPLALQNVPGLVWDMCDRIASMLVPHIISSFEEKCPVHVVVAKTIPAARFTNLLKKARTANIATLQMSRMLDDPQARTQMWLDLMAMVEPERLLDESAPPPESFATMQGVLKHDLRTLIDPVEGELVTKSEDDQFSAYANFLNEPHMESPGVLSLEFLDQPSGLLEKWISWLESLPMAFESHHPQCMLDWHSKFWRSLMTQVGQGAAHSYQSWYFVEAFSTQLLGWMAEMQGMLAPEEEQRMSDEREQEKKREHIALTSNAQQMPAHLQGQKRKRDDENDGTGIDERLAKRAESSRPSHSQQQPLRENPNSANVSNAPTPDSLPDTSHQTQHQPVEPTLPEMPNHTQDEETDAELDELSRGGPLDLPSIHLGLTSPVKVHGGQGTGRMNEDSGIDLGLDIEIDPEGEKESKKFNKRDWLLSSDPVEGVGLGMGVKV